RLFESSQHCGAAAGSRAAVSAHGGIFERESAGRGYGVFLGATEGIRLGPDACPKSALSERHRIVARAARIIHLVATPNRLRQRNDLYFGASQAAERRAGFRRELDCGYRSCRTSPPIRSSKVSRS